MTPSKLQVKVLASRAAKVRRMIEGIEQLPLDDFSHFQSDRRNLAAADSYLRRALEALLDLGRHVAARGYGRPVTEYRRVGPALVEAEVLDEAEGLMLRKMAGYRNRLVHFYQEISDWELFEICIENLNDIEKVLTAILTWAKNHPEKVEGSL
ncbi:MAG: DUF86 domain-containing protein [Acidobacteriota bacterium]